MEILFFLLIATICILGVVAGNVFVATFVSIPIGGLLLLCAAGGGPASGNWIAGCVLALGLIWGRVAIRHSPDNR